MSVKRKVRLGPYLQGSPRSHTEKSGAELVEYGVMRVRGTPARSLGEMIRPMSKRTIPPWSGMLQKHIPLPVSKFKPRPFKMPL